MLAAGTYGSPSILLRSGVGNPDELRRLDITPSVPLSGVGKNLHDQPTVDVRFGGTEELSRSVDSWMNSRHRAEEPILLKAASSKSDGGIDLHVFPVAETPYEGREWCWVLPVALLPPRSRGELRLTSADFNAPPAISHGFFSDPEGADLSALVDGVRIVLALAERPPLRDLIGSCHSRPPSGEAELANWILSSHGRYWHPVGTCAMGPEPTSGAVTDADGRVHGLSNCYVVDASIMPTVPRANTNIPTAATSSRIVEKILERRREWGRCADGRK